MPVYLDAAHNFISVTLNDDSHKYLGWMLSGDLRHRGRTMLAYRLRVAWAKFSRFRRALVDKHIDIELRLRLFDTVVTPSALYGLTTAPLAKKDEEHLAATQRKMLRLMVGYVKLPEDSWEDMYRRLRHKIDKALEKQPVRMWAEMLHANRDKLKAQLAAGTRCTLTCQVASWSPTDIKDDKLANPPSRKRGRPRVRWCA